MTQMTRIIYFGIGKLFARMTECFSVLIFDVFSSDALLVAETLKIRVIRANPRKSAIQTFPSTIAISSSVKSYKQYTSLSISPSSFLVFALELETLAAMILSTLFSILVTRL